MDLKPGKLYYLLAKAPIWGVTPDEPKGTTIEMESKIIRKVSGLFIKKELSNKRDVIMLLERQPFIKEIKAVACYLFDVDSSDFVAILWEGKIRIVHQNYLIEEF